MKQVINTTQPKNVVHFSEACTGRYYGWTNDDDSIGFIGRREFHSGYFTMFCFAAATKGNTVSSYDSNNLQDLISKVLSRGLFKIYEFDTYKELLQWVLDSELKNC